MEPRVPDSQDGSEEVKGVQLELGAQLGGAGSWPEGALDNSPSKGQELVRQDLGDLAAPRPQLGLVPFPSGPRPWAVPAPERMDRRSPALAPWVDGSARRGRVAWGAEWEAFVLGGQAPLLVSLEGKSTLRSEGGARL